MMNKKGKTVLVGLSGGVDSAVAAKLLLEDGWSVAGCTLRLMPPCTKREEKDDIAIESAKKIANTLGIAHFIYDGREAFEKEVLGYVVSTFRRGDTPNPCYVCNRHIKFGFFLQKALREGFDYIATGHYARLIKRDGGGIALLKGLDSQKDQSYFLSSLSQEQLERSVFPLGHLQKSEVKEIAKRSHIATEVSKESQDICFVENGELANFVQRLSPPNSFPEGFFIDESGKKLKKHKGMQFYTIGQRRGLDIAQGFPVYVVKKDVENNTITVGSRNMLKCSHLEAEGVNLIENLPIGEKIEVKVRTRYRQKEKDAYLILKENEKALVQFEQYDEAVATGQIVAFYIGECCKGSAVITKTFP